MKKIYKKEIQRLMPLFRAIAEGKTIQWNDMGAWRNIDGDDEGFFLDTFVGETDGYRIKPEPKYRPFKDAEECWQEMQKHQPFGWVKDKKDGYYVLITAVDNGDYMSLSGNSGWSFYSLMKDYTFTDDIPFGIKVE